MATGSTSQFKMSSGPAAPSSGAGGRRPSLPPVPDLTHLSEEERKIIEDVLRRQRDEEDKEQESVRYVLAPFLISIPVPAFLHMHNLHASAILSKSGVLERGFGYYIIGN
jgi:hypothetical protein